MTIKLYEVCNIQQKNKYKYSSTLNKKGVIKIVEWERKILNLSVSKE